LADLGHELRTPLTVLQGEIEALVDGIHPPNNEQLNRLLEEISVMSRLLDDLRTLSLSEAGELKLEKEPVDLLGLIEDAVATYRGSAERAGVKIAIEGGQAEVVADPVRLREVIANLLSNALRHSQAGDLVTIRHRPAGPGREVAVIDQGPGIAPDLLPRIFERFVKGPGSTGTGLGLAIARDLVRAHSGSIEASNRAEGGTEIRFTLPPVERTVRI
jgi:two-component system sensor histidine kinase BaeS